MKRPFLLIVSLMLCLGFTAVDTCGQKRGTSLPQVNLKMTISNFDSLGNLNYITNDGLGEYVDGLQGVTARLDTSGFLEFNTAPIGTSPVLRSMLIDWNHPVDPNNLYRPIFARTPTFHLTTLNAIPIQNLGTPGNPMSQCVQVGLGVNDGTTIWTESWHKGQENTDNSPTAWGLITRTSISPAVWMLTVNNNCNPNAANIASIRTSNVTGKSTSTLRGYWNLSFVLVLTAK